MRYEDYEDVRTKINELNDLQKVYKRLTVEMDPLHSSSNPGISPTIELYNNGRYVAISLDLGHYLAARSVVQSALVTKMRNIHKDLTVLGVTDIPEIPEEDLDQSKTHKCELGLSNNLFKHLSDDEKEDGNLYTEIVNESNDIVPAYNDKIAEHNIDKDREAPKENSTDIMNIIREIASQ